MLSLQTSFLENLRFSNAQLSTLKVIGEYRGKQALYTQQTPEVLNSLREVSLIESTESSNRIEGILAPHARVKQLVSHATEPRNRSEQEIAGYRDVLALIHENATEMPLTRNVILQIHQNLYKYKTGRGWHESQHDVMPWLNYFWGTLIAAYAEFEDRVGFIQKGKGSKTEQIH